jgi:transcriptional regulator with XRE-family HTH domain
MSEKPEKMPPVVSEGSGVESVGARLKRLRLKRGFSQRDLSSPGVSYAYISRIEAGARTPSVKALRKLSQKLGVSVEYLETGRDIREVDERELKLTDAELELRLAEDTGAAEQKLRDLLAEATNVGDHPSASRARIALGLAAAQRGNHLDAVEQLEAALRDHRVSPHAKPNVYATLAQSYSALGAPDRAVRLLEECLQELEEIASDDTGAYIRFSTYLSYALSDAGNYERAAEVVKSAIGKADDVADPYGRVRLLWSLARIAGIEGRSSEALDYIRRAITLLEATEHTVQLGRAYLLSAGIEATESHADATREQLRLAKKLLGASAEPLDLAMLQIGRSRLAAIEGDGGRAVERAREALTLLGDFHGDVQGAAVAALARGLALAGDEVGAIDAYRRAVDLLTVHGRRAEAGHAALEWASFLREHGREDEAEPILRRAYDLGVDADTAATKS